MVRWIRIIALVLVALGFIALGVAIGLYLVANWRWVPVETPEMLRGVLGDKEREVWLPALLGGWLVGVLGLGALMAWVLFYVWRRRQSDVLVRRLEHELAELRNLPFKRPAPMEDLPGDDEEPGDLDERGEAVTDDPVGDRDEQALDDSGDDSGDGGDDSRGGEHDGAEHASSEPGSHSQDVEDRERADSTGDKEGEVGSSRERQRTRSGMGN